jgi:hypothetical protein
MEAKTQRRRIDKFFSGPGARADDWRDLVEAAKAWADGSADRSRFEALLSELAVTAAAGTLIRHQKPFQRSESEMAGQWNP